jgi:hypothetical protein
VGIEREGEEGGLIDLCDVESESEGESGGLGIESNCVVNRDALTFLLCLFDGRFGRR